MDRKQQLAFWLDNKPAHTDDENKHVPDYSCCYPNLQAPKKVKELYLGALEHSDLEQVKFFERIFDEELQKELEKFEEALHNIAGYKDEMFVNIVKKLHKDEEV